MIRIVELFTRISGKATQSIILLLFTPTPQEVDRPIMLFRSSGASVKRFKSIINQTHKTRTQNDIGLLLDNLLS